MSSLGQYSPYLQHPRAEVPMISILGVLARGQTWLLHVILRRSLRGIGTTVILHPKQMRKLFLSEVKNLRKVTGWPYHPPGVWICSLSWLSKNSWNRNLAEAKELIFGIAKQNTTPTSGKPTTCSTAADSTSCQWFSLCWLVRKWLQSEINLLLEKKWIVHIYIHLVSQPASDSFINWLLFTEHWRSVGTKNVIQVTASFMLSRNLQSLWRD